MKTAFVLSGGGAKGAFQVGVIEKLFHAGIEPDVIYGTSVGALNAACFAHGGVDRMKAMWKALKSRGDVLSMCPFNLLFGSGLYSMAPLKKLIEKATEGEALCEAVACTVRLHGNGDIVYFSNRGEHFRAGTLASACIPVVMEAVEIPHEGKSQLFVDGGVREQTPLKRAILDGADKIVVILCNPYIENSQDNLEWKPTFPKMASILMRTLDIMEHEIFVNDIARCIRGNDEPGKRKIQLEVYTPSAKLYDTLEFDPVKIAHAIELGYNASPVVKIDG